MDRDDGQPALRVVEGVAGSPCCWFLHRLEDAGPCSGPMQKAHIIPKSIIKRELRQMFVSEPMALQRLIWHPSTWVWGCWRHHSGFDNVQWRISREQVPEVTERFADIFGLGWCLDHRYGELPSSGPCLSPPQPPAPPSSPTRPAPKLR